MANRPAAAITDSALLDRFTQTSICGGSALTEHTAVTVSPLRAPACTVVTRLTAPGTPRMQARNVSLSIILAGRAIPEAGSADKLIPPL